MTKGGLIFFGSIQGKLRAIDVETGRQIWSDSLVRSSGATPMSYMSPNTGRQYILVTVPLSSLDLTAEDLSEGPADTRESTQKGGRVVAYSLPD